VQRPQPDTAQLLVQRRARLAPGGRELGHVGADLGDQDLSGPLSDARDRYQQVPGSRERGDLISLVPL
jgi:hypothetical protein